MGELRRERELKELEDELRVRFFRSRERLREAELDEEELDEPDDEDDADDDRERFFDLRLRAGDGVELQYKTS